MKKERTFQELLAMTRRVIQAFDAAEQRPWTIETTVNYPHQELAPGGGLRKP